MARVNGCLLVRSQLRACAGSCFSDRRSVTGTEGKIRRASKNLVLAGCCVSRPTPPPVTGSLSRAKAEGLFSGSHPTPCKCWLRGMDDSQRTGKPNPRFFVSDCATPAPKSARRNTGPGWHHEWHFRRLAGSCPIEKATPLNLDGFGEPRARRWREWRPHGRCAR